MGALIGELPGFTCEVSLPLGRLANLGFDPCAIIGKRTAALLQAGQVGADVGVLLGCVRHLGLEGAELFAGGFEGALLVGAKLFASRESVTVPLAILLELDAILGELIQLEPRAGE